VTVAPGTTPPEESVTTPPIAPSVVDWASVPKANKNDAASKANETKQALVLEHLL
jgi:hypothetical protein